MNASRVVNKPSIHAVSFVDCVLSGIAIGFGESLSSTYLSKIVDDPFILGVFLSLPLAMAAVAQILLPKEIRNLPPKQTALLFSLLQGFSLLAIAAASRGPKLYEIELLAGLTLYWFAVLNTTAGLQEVFSKSLPQSQLARFQSQRQMINSGIVLICFFATALLLGRNMSQEIVEMLFIVSAMARFLTTILMSYLPSVPKDDNQLGSYKSHQGFISKKGVSLFSVCALAFLFRGSASVSSSYYLKWLLSDLSFSLVVYSVMISIPLVVRVVSCSNWGRIIDENRLWDALVASVFLIAATPVASAFSSSSIAVGMTQLFSGLGWAGFEVISLLLIQRMFPNRVMAATGYFLASGYLGTVMGSAFGAEILKHGLGYQALFLVSAIMRSLSGFAMLNYYHRRNLFRFKSLRIRYTVWSAMSLHPTIHLISRVFVDRPRGGHRLTHSGKREIREKHVDAEKAA